VRSVSVFAHIQGEQGGQQKQVDNILNLAEAENSEVTVQLKIGGFSDFDESLPIHNAALHSGN
jgi:hypothetical protein